MSDHIIPINYYCCCHYDTHINIELQKYQGVENKRECRMCLVQNRATCGLQQNSLHHVGFCPWPRPPPKKCYPNMWCIDLHVESLCLTAYLQSVSCVIASKLEEIIPTTM